MKKGIIYKRKKVKTILFKKSKYIKTAAAVAVTTTLLFSNTVMAASSILKIGSSGSEVSQLQIQLKNLGYYNYSVDGIFGPITKNAVISFQRSKGLSVDGIAGPETFAALKPQQLSSRSGDTRGEAGTTEITATLRHGTKGVQVKKLQQKLSSLGFYSYSIDGVFGPLTEKSVKAFQESAGITVDGVAGPSTISKLYNSSSNSTQTTSPSLDTASRGTSVETLSWSQVDKMFPRKSTARVTDVDTGKSFNIYRLGGYWHADVEPLTAEDTAIMKEVYGGNWSWNRRAVIVEINSRKIAASMNGMPHGQQDIYNNNFDGQFCIHFLGSRVHKSGKVDSKHQAMVKKAANAR